MKPGPAISSASTQRCTAGCALQRVDQRLRQFARVLLQRLGQLHRGGAGEVAVRGLLGRLEGRRQRGARGHSRERRGQGRAAAPV